VTNIPVDPKYIESLVALDSIKIQENEMSPLDYKKHLDDLTTSIYLNGETRKYITENKSEVFGYNVSDQDIVVKIEDGYIRTYNKQINGVNRVIFVNDYVNRNSSDLANFLVGVDLFGSGTSNNSWIRGKILDKAKELLYDRSK
jgi:hypothetical protein